MDRDGIVVKGTRNGLLIVLGEGPWAEGLTRLAARLEGRASFFQGGRATLDVGGRELDAERIEEVQALLARYGVELVALLSTCDATVLATVRAGLMPNLSGVERQPAGEEHPQGEGECVLERTLRAGQRVERLGDVVIVGDVHAGAEVIAGRHVIVWGKLHGVVHAGATGNAEAVVCALDLAPTQLRIANYIARSPDEKRRKTAPEMARVRHGRIEAVPWSGREVSRTG